MTDFTKPKLLLKDKKVLSFLGLREFDSKGDFAISDSNVGLQVDTKFAKIFFWINYDFGRQYATIGLALRVDS